MNIHCKIKPIFTLIVCLVLKEGEKYDQSLDLAKVSRTLLTISSARR